MKNLKAITLITLFLVAMSATSLLAQGRNTRTSSAKAAYGYPAEYNSKKKKKKQKQRKAPRRKTKAPMDRKRSGWVN